MLIYPLKVVVTTNEAFASVYDVCSESLVLTSGCLGPEKVRDLLCKGARFQAIVSVDGEGEEIIGEVITAALEDQEHGGDTQIWRVFLNPEDPPEVGINAVHALLRSLPENKNIDGGG